MSLDQPINQSRPLNITTNQSELLAVEQVLWQTQLRKYERKASLLFIGLLLLLLVGSYFFSSIAYRPLFWLVLAFAFVYKITNAQKARNLRKHGLFEYEFFQDRIIRHSDSGEDIFKFKELKEIRVKPYGMVLKKEKKLYDYLGLSIYRYHRTRQMLIPNQLRSFQAIKNFIRLRTGNAPIQKKA